MLKMKWSKTDEDFFINRFMDHINNQEKKKTQKIQTEMNKISEQTNSSPDLEAIPLKEKALEMLRIRDLLRKTKNKLQLGTKTRESKFLRTMKPFTELTSFFDIKALLHEMNLTNTQDLNPMFAKIKNRLKRDEKGVYYLEKEQEKIGNLEEKNKPVKTLPKKAINKDNSQKKMFNFEIPGRLSASLEKSSSIKAKVDLSSKVVSEFNERILKIKEKGSESMNFTGKKLLDVKIGDYLLKEYEPVKSHRNEINFNENLLEKIRNHSLFEDNPAKQNFDKNQETINKELQILQNFIMRNKQEHLFKEEIAKGLYLEAFRNQAEKIRLLLKKATRTIYQNKSKSIDAKSSINNLSPKSFNMEKFLDVSKETSIKSFGSKEKCSPKNFNLRNQKSNRLKTFFEGLTDPFLTTPHARQQKNDGSKPLHARTEFCESPINIGYLSKKIPKKSIEVLEKMLTNYESKSLNIREELKTLKQSVLPSLRGNIELLDKTNIKKYLIAEKNHKENQKMKRMMSEFLDKVEKNLEKSKIDKRNYEMTCEKIFEDGEKIYERMFPPVLESIQIHKNAFDIQKIKKMRLHTKQKSLNFKSKGLI